MRSAATKTANRQAQAFMAGAAESHDKLVQEAELGAHKATKSRSDIPARADREGYDDE
jgi:hypothetical protein